MLTKSFFLKISRCSFGPIKKKKIMLEKYSNGLFSRYGYFQDAIPAMLSGVCAKLFVLITFEYQRTLYIVILLVNKMKVFACVCLALGSV